MTLVDNSSGLDKLKARISDHLSKIYPDENPEQICQQIVELMDFKEVLHEAKQHCNLWSENDIIAIT